MLPENTIVVAGPVIIEDGKVLLNREIKSDQDGIESPFFMFPGGKLKNLDESFEQACTREVHEELGIDIQILRPLKTMLVKRPDVADGYALLIHFLAKRVHLSDVEPPADHTVEWGWFNTEDLPKNCTDNVREVIADYLNEPAV